MRIRLPLIIAAGLLAAGIAVPAHAQKGPMTLAEAVSTAQQRAPAQQAADAALRAADANAATAAQRPNPSLSFEAENVMGTGPYAGFGGGERTLSLAVPIELGGKRNARRRVAQAERAAASLGVATTRADVTQRATEAFIATVTAERRLEVANSGYELAGKGAHAASERVRAGKASPIEEQRAEVVRINAAVRLGKAERALALAQADLARVTGSTLPVSIAAGWFESVNAQQVQVELGALPSVARAEAEVAAASARVDAARRDRIPDATLTLGTRRYGASPDRAAVVGISVPLPLFNTGTAGLIKTRADYDRAIAERNVVELETSQTVAHAQAELADAAALAQAANGPVLAAAEEAARIARIGYAEGKFPQLELLEAERSLAQTREDALDALAAFHIAQARLAHLRGSTNPIYKD